MNWDRIFSTHWRRAVGEVSLLLTVVGFIACGILRSSTPHPEPELTLLGKMGLTCFLIWLSLGALGKIIMWAQKEKPEWRWLSHVFMSLSLILSEVALAAYVTFWTLLLIDKHYHPPTFVPDYSLPSDVAFYIFISTMPVADVWNVIYCKRKGKDARLARD